MLAHKKPWGYEYLLFENQEVAIWHLSIEKWKCTSLHCHPKKKTGLVVIGGAAKVDFLNGTNKLFAGEKIMIRHGVFHRTTNMVSETLQMFEIETPVNKSDIVRLGDQYGRQGVPHRYEDKIEVTGFELAFSSQKIADCYVSKVTEVDLNSLPDLVMVTRNGIKSNEHFVVSPGDILDRNTFLSLVDRFSLLQETQYIGVSSCISEYMDSY